ncbi:MAG TPA: glucose-6-phosphate isomerase [Gammaproteobacteria bacterium]|nr:MAG: glucose-6-phosphate isomerase [bacterium]HDH15772.1 glucose-6-phosphate isomerase [Gammaproteobacteria bacterium]
MTESTPRLTNLPAWKKLQAHYDEISSLHMRELFASQPNRFEEFSITLDSLFLDYSKNRINLKTMQLLTDLARECCVPEAIDSMFKGEKINTTEDREVLHTALRSDIDKPFIIASGDDVMPEIRAELEKMKRFCDAVHKGENTGHTGKTFTSIVNIGIGGSDLGPHMVVNALKFYQKDLDIHFVSNVDDADIAETLKKLNPETTLFIISSKTFTTWETLTNAHSARDWFLQSGANQTALSKHFIAVSSNIPAATAFGITEENIFEFWDWVGGRYSLWSAIGLSIALAVGFDRFSELLAGANSMDKHFREVPLERNIPVILGLLGIWYNNFFGADTQAIIPYDQYLQYLPAYLQQADMESNGKHVTKGGEEVDYSTGPIIWGTTGTNGQHAYFQLLHQGTRLIPVDFIAPVESLNNIGIHHRLLIANFLAQTEALVRGKTRAEARATLEKSGLSEKKIEEILPHKVFPGNQPTNTLFYQKLTPWNLGALIAMYEHKIFVQGVIWDINSFDQWGVELGKKLARIIYDELEDSVPVKTHGQSTRGLINYFKKKSP